jgi:hypothetical protein
VRVTLNGSPPPSAAVTLGISTSGGIAKPVRWSCSRLPPGGASTVRTTASKPASIASAISARVTPASLKG